VAPRPNRDARRKKAPGRMVLGGDHASPPYHHLGFSRAFSRLRWPRSPPLAAPCL